MHSMVGAFGQYTVKRRRVEIVRGYCYQFFQCSFPCGIVMLVLSVLFIIVGTTQLIYIIHFNGCSTFTVLNGDSNASNNLSTVSSSFSSSSSLSSSSPSFKCNRQTIKVLGITFVVTGSVLFLISLLITKYSRSSEENNVIRTTTSSMITNNVKPTHNQHHHHPIPHYYHTPSSSLNDQKNIIVSIQ